MKIDPQPALREAKYAPAANKINPTIFRLTQPGIDSITSLGMLRRKAEVRWHRGQAADDGEESGWKSAREVAASAAGSTSNGR